MQSKKKFKSPIKSTAPLLGKIIQKIAPKIGATVIMEPEWNIAGQIIFKNGRKRYLKYSSLDLNTLAASDIAKDKDYANFFMKRMGYPTISGKTFFSKEWCKRIGSDRNVDAGYKYAKQLGLPLIVKPNGGSQGVGVAMVSNKREFYKAMNFIFTQDKVALVQRVVRGKDYRVVVLDNEVISAYLRIPLNVTGNGKSTISKLIKEKQRAFIASGRDTVIDISDPRIKTKLERQGLSLKHIPRAGEKVYLLDNANLSTGGDSKDITKNIHPEFKKIAVKLTKDMGLRVCGVDFMIEGSIEEKPQKYWIIEINAAPGLDHYIKTGREQEKIVESFYLKILKSLER